MRYLSQISDEIWDDGIRYSPESGTSETFKCLPARGGKINEMSAVPPYSALSEGRIHSQIRKRSVRRKMCPRGYRMGVPVDLGVKSM